MALRISEKMVTKQMVRNFWPEDKGLQCLCVIKFLLWKDGLSRCCVTSCWRASRPINNCPASTLKPFAKKRDTVWENSNTHKESPTYKTAVAEESVTKAFTKNRHSSQCVTFADVPVRPVIKEPLVSFEHSVITSVKASHLSDGWTMF